MIKESEVYQSTEAPPSDYGVDYDGPLPNNEVGTVCVPETLCPLDNEDIDQFLACVDTVSQFEDLSIGHFIECKQILHTLLEQ